MQSNLSKMIFSFLVVANVTACGNIFKGASNKTTDQAYYEDALKSIDAQDWGGALTKFELLSSDFAASASVKENWAGALAGKCGLDFVGVFEAIGGGDPLLKGAMNAFTGVEIEPEYCIFAQEKMEEIGATPSLRTSSQNLFMLVLGLGKIGAYLRADADIDGTGNLGDDSMDAGFDACENHEFPVPAGVPPATDLGDGLFSENELNQIVTGFGLILMNFASIADDLSGGTGDALADVDAACSAIVPNPCNITDPSSVDAQTRYTFAAMIHSSTATTEIQIGIGACNGSLVTCCGQ